MKNILKSPLVIAVMIIVIILGFSFWQKSKNSQAVEKTKIKVGIVTDLSGPAAAYWGESTRVGVEIAKKELQKEGYSVEVVFEDYQLDAAKAVTSAQKLINIDAVDAIYAEFNPAAIAINSIVKDKNMLFVYDSAVTSPLKDNQNAFKTYLDYQAGCKEIAQKFKDQGIAKIGMVKLNLEAGELCLTGLKEVYGDNVVAEAFNIGEVDFKTQVLKLKNAKAGAVVNTAFEGDTLNTLKAMKELKFDVPFGTVDDTITPNVISKYSDMLKGAWTFGFVSVDKDFSAKVLVEAGKQLPSDYGAAIAYTHIKQMVKAIEKCNKEITCVNSEMSKSNVDGTVGFKNFDSRIADLSMSIKQY